MKLEEAKKHAKEMRDVAAAMDYTEKAIALDIVLEHAKNPVTVTDDMVERVISDFILNIDPEYTVYDDYQEDGTIGIDGAFDIRSAMKAALTAALGE